jgi:hypothetical protein
MFGHRFFGARFFGPRYFGGRVAAAVAPSIANAGAIASAEAFGLARIGGARAQAAAPALAGGSSGRRRGRGAPIVPSLPELALVNCGAIESAEAFGVPTLAVAAAPRADAAPAAASPAVVAPPLALHVVAWGIASAEHVPAPRLSVEPAPAAAKWVDDDNEFLLAA